MVGALKQRLGGLRDQSIPFSKAYSRRGLLIQAIPLIQHARIKKNGHTGKRRSPRLMRLFTVGHSNQTLPQLLALLLQEGINAVADVRSMPYSRRLPQFNRPELEAALSKKAIRYVFLGEELGARRDEPAAYDGLQAAYERVAQLPAFQRGLERVISGVKKGHTLSLLCAERDPLTCHRAVLVSRHLSNFGFDVQHIHGDGRIESHGELEQRMQKALQRLGVLEAFNGALQLDLLGNPLSRSQECNPDILLEKAYKEQGKRIAYCKPLIAA